MYTLVRTVMVGLNDSGKQFFSAVTSVTSALEVYNEMRYINLHFYLLTYSTITPPRVMNIQSIRSIDLSHFLQGLTLNFFRRDMAATCVLKMPLNPHHPYSLSRFDCKSLRNYYFSFHSFFQFHTRHQMRE